LSAARKRGDFPAALARAARLSRAMAGEIMRDASGRALAVVAKGGGLERPLHSAICILVLPAPNIFAALTMFDRVPQNGAAHLLSAWRIRLDASLAA
jgi:hypothetical protein